MSKRACRSRSTSVAGFFRRSIVQSKNHHIIIMRRQSFHSTERRRSLLAPPRTKTKWHAIVIGGLLLVVVRLGLINLQLLSLGGTEDMPLNTEGLPYNLSIAMIQQRFENDYRKQQQLTSKNNKYIQLPIPNSPLSPVSLGACCGIGHRFIMNIRTIVYAVSNFRLVYANWTNGDATWNDIFNNTANIVQGPITEEFYPNECPPNWNNSSLAYQNILDDDHVRATPYYYYGDVGAHMLFEMPLAQSIVKILSDNLSPRVLSFLNPLRDQYSKSDLHLCAHVRGGNNETGDWEGKKWRHVDVFSTLNKTLVSMKSFAETRKDAKVVSVFVASDMENARPWFEANAPDNWHIVKPGKVIPRPETGVWFGEHGSTTNSILSQEQKTEAFAEAAADVFALGECHALFIPNYSSFSIFGIMLTRAERNKVFFLETEGDYIEYP